eukprot:349861-Chlamydomonas_euryale.AAC.1
MMTKRDMQLSGVGVGFSEQLSCRPTPPSPRLAKGRQNGTPKPNVTGAAYAEQWSDRPTKPPPLRCHPSTLPQGEGEVKILGRMARHWHALEQGDTHGAPDVRMWTVWTAEDLALRAEDASRFCPGRLPTPLPAN